ncbi:MAG: hypothetical protein HY043_20020 [Verrucomicrobia bacterium]|nr:hypothetical protein [Verrucomicrobiota bacterium]
MPSRLTLLILSDVHYAGPAEQQRRDHESRVIRHPLLRLAARLYRHHIWLRDPFAHNHLLGAVLAPPRAVDFAIANGDFSCDTAFIGVSDDAALQSARECLAKLRARFGKNFRATMGDHELGKMSLIGQCGGMRLASWERAQTDLNMEPFWQMELGRYVLMGVTSSLLALPVYQHDTLPREFAEWEKLRAEHVAVITRAFAALHPDQRVLLFCHDPTALPFLGREAAVRERFTQIEQTIIGHLHTPLVFWQSRLLAGLPPVRWLGHTIRRLTTALHQARHWRPFKPRLCPSLAGCELLHDGGYYLAQLDAEAREPLRFEFQKLPRDGGRTEAARKK